MAFYHSRVLRGVIKYSQEAENSFMIDPKKMVYNPERYGYQYSNKMIKEGYEKGAKFLNRIPKYRKLHPEIMDAILGHRAWMVFGIAAVVLFSNFMTQDRLDQNKEMIFDIFREKAFVDRHAFKQLDVEYFPRENPPYPL